MIAKVAAERRQRRDIFHGVYRNCNQCNFSRELQSVLFFKKKGVRVYIVSHLKAEML